MTGSKQFYFIILLSLFFAFCEAKSLKCVPTICPPCNIQLNLTYDEILLRVYSLSPPVDGSCLTGQKYKIFGKDYNRTNDACCCAETNLKESNLQCNPPAPGTPYCANSLGTGRNVKIADIYNKTATLLKDAPPDGCCRRGTFKYIYPKELLGIDHDICTCVIDNMADVPTEHKRRQMCQIMQTDSDED